MWLHMGCVWEIPRPKMYNHVSGCRLSPRSKNPKKSGTLKFRYIYIFLYRSKLSKSYYYCKWGNGTKLKRISCRQVGMDPSLVQVKKIKKEDARLPSETSRQLPDSEPKCDKLKTSRSPPPLLMNLRLQVRFAILEYLLGHSVRLDSIREM